MLEGIAFLAYQTTEHNYQNSYAVGMFISLYIFVLSRVPLDDFVLILFELVWPVRTYLHDVISHYNHLRKHALCTKL